ncbi:MAG: hypothetical protein M3501_11030, partial [Actinomycetota bacterium]|nr:hypothetical protein [Actinomycetota bacterium]
RIELAHWVVEQAISETAHRYGRLLESTGVDRLRGTHRSREHGESPKRSGGGELVRRARSGFAGRRAQKDQ